MKLLFSCTVPGRAIVKKNTQRTVGYGKSKHVIYSPKYTTWKRSAHLVFVQKHRARTITCLLEARYKFYFKNHQSEADVSNLVEGPQDELKNAHVISDDKLIMRIVAEKFFGEEPRTEIELYEFEEINEASLCS